LNEQLELRAEKKMSLITSSVTHPTEGLSDDEMSELITLRKENNASLQCVFNQYSPPAIVHSFNPGWHRTC